MVIRLAVILIIVCVLFRYAFGRWPWQMLTSPPTRAQALDRARKLLGVPKGASRGEIKDAHKRLITMVHPDRGGSNVQVHEANDARDLLLSELPEEETED